MRPIRLEFAGLQSYRELQVIDFADLLGGGLFGIFGPTGSGKSTILDAITLAMYGRVGRAERGTIGIMNQGENRLTVKFAFSLGSEATYRVERSYRREKETESVRSEHCRLIEIVGGLERVLADKERDVNEQVAEILGLKLEDFTRAVVLPQGQFAEFLQLSGRDRTQMLQRIFSLAQYGDKLNQRLKRRIEALNQQLIGVQGEQLGLGDASAEAVARAEEQLQEAETRVAVAEQELAAMEESFRTWEKVWELQQELTAVVEALARWQERTPEADGWRLELAGARRAELVRPHLELERQARRQAEQAEVRLAEIEQALARAVAAEREAAAAHEAARTRRSQEGPALTERRIQLQQAVALEATLSEIRQQVATLSERVAKGERATAEVAAQISAGEAALAELAGTEAALRSRQSAAEVDADHRARMLEARRLLDRLREAEQALVEARRRLEARQQQRQQVRRAAEQARAERDSAQVRYEQHEQALKRLEEAPPATDEELRSQAAWLSQAEERIRAVVQAVAVVAQRQTEQEQRTAETARLTGDAAGAALAEAHARQGLDDARQGLVEARTQLEDANRHEHAVALIQSLTPDQPCPVCGSTEHPRPATAEATIDLAAARATVERAEQAVRQAEQALEQAVRHRADAEGRAATARRLEQEAGESIAQAGTQLAEARARLPETWRTLSPEALPDALRQQQVEQDDRRQRYQAWQTELTALRQGRDDQGRIAATAAAEASGRDATLSAAERSLFESEAEATAQTATVDGRRAEFDQGRGEHDAAGIEAEQRRIEAADREAAGLRQEMERLRRLREAAEQELADGRRNHEKYAQVLQDLKVEREKAQARLEETESQWQARTGGQPAAPQLQAVEQSLQRLEQAEADATGARELAERALGKASSDQAAAYREREISVQRLTEAAEGLGNALAAAGFADQGAARAGLRSPERQAELERALTEYEREGDRWQSRQTILTVQLNGRSLSPEQWQDWQDRREQSRTALAQQRDERTRAKQVRDDLQAKQRRWQELEEQRTLLTTSLNNLEDLRSLLRGNAFVDFLAEEQMSRVAAEASVRLGQLSRHRYALETESGGGFVIRDDGNGGARRAVTTLSGGETFLTSLSLALALSAQIQLRGHYPLEFFFLDEGFGTLDPELLDVVISTLERLHFENLHVGVISHVPELRSRLQRRVIVEPAEPGGRGSRARLELA